jgi:hypothetical protein
MTSINNDKQLSSVARQLRDDAGEIGKAAFSPLALAPAVAVAGTAEFVRSSTTDLSGLSALVAPAQQKSNGSSQQEVTSSAAPDPSMSKVVNSLNSSSLPSLLVGLSFVTAWVVGTVGQLYRTKPALGSSSLRTTTDAID